MEPDYSDARFCIVTELVPKDEFEAQYPKASVADFETEGTSDKITWGDDKTVRVAEYFWVEKVKKKLVI